MISMPRIAFCQPNIIQGGRLQVILDTIVILNEMGIVPDILTGGLSFDLETIEERYGQSAQFKVRFVPSVKRWPPDIGILVFNRLLRRYAHKYDLLINTSNTIDFLPATVQILTYMFYPRKSRIMAPSPDIHQPEEPLKWWSKQGVMKTALRAIYRLSSPHPNHSIVCMTQFTRDALCESYPYLHQDMPLVYPGVETAQFDCQDTWVERQRAIVSVGRFSPAKRQLEQIKLARTMTDTPFHIVGFVNDAHKSYYDECVAYIKQHHVDNVHLYPGAAFEEMVGLLQKSRYFLHTLINEPFGLTAVHAIAAGCIPIVHDSGGQRETVMKSELRYQTLEDIPGMIGKIEQLDNIQLESMREELKAHIRLHFDRSIFHGQMREILTDVINHLELVLTDHE